MHFLLILLACILNEICGTRIPLEIVQLENSGGGGTRLNDEKIANTEYQVHDVDDPSSYSATKHSNKNVNKTGDDWFTRLTANRKSSTRDVQEPRIFYQVGVSIDKKNTKPSKTKPNTKKISKITTEYNFV